MLDILRVLETKDNYSKYITIVKRLNTDIELKKILSTIDKYYSNYSNNTIAWDSFSTFFFLVNPKLTETQELIYKNIFSSLCVPSSVSVDSLLNILSERYYAERIYFLTQEVVEGRRASLLDAQKEFDAYLRESKNVSDIEAETVSEDLEALLREIEPGSGLRWRLDPLNVSLGELPAGRFVSFAGRPDAGKTALLCSEGSYLVQQLPEDKKLYYFCNEESGREVKRRFICSALNKTIEEVDSDKLTAWNDYVKLLGGNQDKVTIVRKRGLSASDVEHWLDRGDAGIILFDQLRKLQGFDSMAGVGKLESIFNLAREWAKEYAPLINVSQLGADASNVPYPTESMLYESKTAALGETDAHINIGWVQGSIPANLRYLNVVRNKFPRPGDPDKRLAKYECLLDSDRARFKI